MAWSLPGVRPRDESQRAPLVCFRDVNTAVMELLIMAYALKTACARNIIGVIPYFPYSKQSKMRKRGSIVCKLLASMLAKAGECGRPVPAPARPRLAGLV